MGREQKIKVGGGGTRESREQTVFGAGTLTTQANITIGKRNLNYAVY